MKPKVSVIVPVYNVENYLEKCLNSLISQTLLDIEIIVINDGSTDSSGKIAKQYAENYTKIRAFDKVNGGLSDARNYGIDKATGEYIAFVDSDDYVEPQMMQKLWDLATKHNAEIVICNLQKVDENGKLTQKLTQIPHFDEEIDLMSQFSVFSDISYFACNKLFHRKLFVNSRFKKGIHFEDIELIPQLLLKCTKIAKTDAFLYHYLERSNSISKTHTKKGLDILNAIKSVEKAFDKSNYQHKIKELKGFQILEGYYTFLSYMAFVKDDIVFNEMNAKLLQYIKERHISKIDILLYQRFGSNYLLSLPIKKKLFYIVHLLGYYKLLKKLTQF